ncbi:MAG: hypothetical protein GX119_04130 [Syntrophomonadaceae bacterium]|jgi:hypothetical protein|nr:hypothetical protein [Syntrophomonadaceae bacterium]
MMMVLLSIVIFIFIALIEVPGLLRKNQKRELIAFVALLLPGMAITIMLSLNIRVPNPVKGIEYLVQHLLQYLSTIMT